MNLLILDSFPPQAWDLSPLVSLIQEYFLCLERLQLELLLSMKQKNVPEAAQPAPVKRTRAGSQNGIHSVNVH